MVLCSPQALAPVEAHMDVGGRMADRLLAVASIAVGLGCVALFAPWMWVGLDFDRVLAAGDAWRTGSDPYAIYGYLYTPAMTAVASLVPPGTWAVWAAIELAVVVVVAPRNAWALVVAMTWPGVWADVVLGNVTIILVAAAMLAIRMDRFAVGMPLGALLALSPKPMFIFVLVWLAIQRPHSLLGVVSAAAAVTAVGAIVAGPTAYGRFVVALIRGVDPQFVGNVGLSYISPILGFVAFMVVGTLAIVLVRRPEDELMAAGIAATFAGTYVGLYSTILPLAILPRYGLANPSVARRIAAVGLASPFVLWGAGIAAILRLPHHRRGSHPRPPGQERRKVMIGQGRWASTIGLGPDGGDGGQGDSRADRGPGFQVTRSDRLRRPSTCPASSRPSR